ncbi:glycerophosphodiester phosphodiesterase family protein [Shimia abyssi]|uniref:Glycerophosphoryl diester phosphodiesterase n=1 Tax=Shimia abyssi TaxID=1662395 RepID=A0A2P8F6C7_9RHOB|nr:glycerophosphodiester phosphodiesterase family protein [Shimia abyssi]PSL17255.1 glycerophosphoryl diester phosphodiesterase [Shimia abyssi]
MHFPAVDAFRGGKGLIRVVGHRGARGILPENSMIGFEFAMNTGAALLEFDVVMTADRVPVITHNTSLHAPTFRGSDGQFIKGEEPKVASLTWAEVQAFDIGRIDGATDYGKRFPDQAQLDGIRVPRLQELLDCIMRDAFSHAHLMLELKSDPDFAEDADYRSEMVSTVVSMLRAGGLENRVLLHSFDWNLLAECQRQAPDIAASFLTQLPENEDEVGEESAKSISPNFQGKSAQIPDMVHAAGGRLWCPYVYDVTEAAVARAKHLDLGIAVWTVNEPADIGRMIDLQVDAIVTDYPGRVQRQLADCGIRWLG